MRKGQSNEILNLRCFIVNTTVSQEKCCVYSTAARATRDVFDQVTADLIAQRCDRVGHVSLRTQGFRAGRNRREGKALGVE